MMREMACAAPLPNTYLRYDLPIWAPISFCGIWSARKPARVRLLADNQILLDVPPEVLRDLSQASGKKNVKNYWPLFDNKITPLRASKFAYIEICFDKPRDPRAVRVVAA